MFRYSALAALCVVAGTAASGELRPMNGNSLDVGTFRGNVYYTETHAGYHVVTTIADGEAGSPVRFEVTLAEGQGVTISTPSGVDEPSDAVQISHVGGKLFVMPVIVPGPNLVTAGQ